MPLIYPIDDDDELEGPLTPRSPVAAEPVGLSGSSRGGQDRDMFAHLQYDKADGASVSTPWSFFFDPLLSLFSFVVCFMKYEPVGTAEEKAEFDVWWLDRFLPIARNGMGQIAKFAIVVTFLYACLVIWYEHLAEASNMIASLAVGAAVVSVYAFVLNYVTSVKWCVKTLSNSGCAVAVILACALLLPGINVQNPCKQSPVLFVAAMFVISQTGISFGMSPQSHWGLFAIPIFYFVTLCAASFLGYADGTSYVWSNTLLLAWHLMEMCFLARRLSVDQDAAWRKSLRTMTATKAEESQLGAVLALLFPPTVLAQLQDSDMADSRFAEEHAQVSILFVDISNLTALATDMAAEQLTILLNDVFTSLDGLVCAAGLFKVETVNSVYVVAAGLPTYREDHAEALCKLAVKMVACVQSFSVGTTPLQCKAGIHTGNVVGGIVGQALPRYRLFGDSMNTASRMETRSLPGRVQVSDRTALSLSVNGSAVRLSCRGKQLIKGKGDMVTYFVESVPADSGPDGDRPATSGSDSAFEDGGLVSEAAPAALPPPALTPAASGDFGAELKKSSAPPSRQSSHLKDDLAAAAAAYSRQNSTAAQKNVDLTHLERRPTVVAASPILDVIGAGLTKRISLQSQGSHGSRGSATREASLEQRADSEARISMTTLRFDSANSEDRYIRHFVSANANTVFITAIVGILLTMISGAWMTLNAVNQWNDATGVRLAIGFGCTLAAQLVGVYIVTGIVRAHKATNRRISMSLAKKSLIASCIGPLVCVVLYTVWGWYIGGIAWTAIPSLIYLGSYVILFAMGLEAFWAIGTVLCCWFVYFLLLGLTYDPTKIETAWEIDFIYLITAVVTPASVIMFIRARVLERFRREDYVLALRCAHRRDAAWSLVSNMIPAPVISVIHERLVKGVEGGHLVAWRFPECVLLQSDLMSFTAMSSKVSAEALCEYLHTLFSAFDILAAELGVNKLETIGDAYVACVGCVTGAEENLSLEKKCGRVAELAFRMQAACARIPGPDGSVVTMRVGVHVTSAVAGIVGTSMLRYHLVGAATDEATALEQTCDAGRVHASASFVRGLAAGTWATEPAAPVIFGKEEQATFHLLPKPGQ